MSRRFVIRPEAEQDLAEAHAWYEAREAHAWYEARREGLGEDFLAEAEACIQNVRRSPLLYPVIYKDARRAILRRFPYAVFYVTTPDITSVIAVSHLRRHPRQWRSRL